VKEAQGHLTTSLKHRFLVLLRDDLDADGLARLLNDVRVEGAEALSEFEAPRPRGGDYLRATASDADDDALAADRTLILEDEPGLEDLLTGRPESFMVGLSDPSRAQDFAALPRVVTFRTAGPLDFAVELMDRFSGPDATMRLFDASEAARMRALASDFPVDLDEPVGGPDERLQEGSQDLEAGRLDDALRVFDSLLAENPDWSKAHLMRGRALRRIADERRDDGLPTGQASEEAKAAFHAAFRTAPDMDSFTLQEIGEHLTTLGDYAGAVNVLHSAIEHRDDAPWLYKSLGTALALDEELDDRFEQAAEAYTTALKLDPTDPMTLFSRGVTQLNLCRYDAALADLDRTRDLQHGEDALTHMYRAVALGALGKLKEARQAAVQASQQQPTQGDRPEWIAYVTAVARLRMDDIDGAQVELQRAEELAAEHDEHVALLAKIGAVRAVILARLGQFDRAHAACAASIQLDPAEPVPYAARAWTLQSTDRLDEARTAITQAVDLVETNPEWSRDCRHAGAKWPLYVIQASILNALCERYADEELAEDAIEATQRAWEDFKVLDDQPERRTSVDMECGAQIFLERAYASVLSGHPVQAAAALRQARALAPPRSTPWFAATRALRAPASPHIRPWAIVSAEVLAIAGSVALLLFGRLASAAFVTLVIGLVTLGLVAFAFPYVTRLGLGTLQLEKVVAHASAQSLPRLAAPLPAPAIPMPPLRLRTPEIPPGWFPDY
jgi:tetratricopeptide (TPR) repeat protein